MTSPGPLPCVTGRGVFLRIKLQVNGLYVGDLGRLRSRQCDRDEPRAVGRFLGRSRCRFQSEHEDFCQHGVPPWFACCFVGGVALAVQIVGESERYGPLNCQTRYPDRTFAKLMGGRPSAKRTRCGSRSRACHLPGRSPARDRARLGPSADAITATLAPAGRTPTVLERDGGLGSSTVAMIRVFSMVIVRARAWAAVTYGIRYDFT